MKAITGTIKSWVLVTDAPPTHQLPVADKLERPRTLSGVTYKVNSPLCDNALYVTINDIVFNAGTPHEIKRPFEIFINTKDVDHQEWVIALTRMISAVFRKGGDIEFVIEELLSVHSSKGGYLRTGGLFVPSLVAEIGHVIKEHMKGQASSTPPVIDGAAICPKCNSKGWVKVDGCEKCLLCGHSKCGG